MNFKLFLESSESEDIKRTLNKLPKKHRELVKNYKINLQGGNTLKGDKEHIGELDGNNKNITVAAPYHFSRETTFLHEIAHQVWESLPETLKQQWTKIIKKTKHPTHQNPEEMFCMCYATHYVKNKLVTYVNPKWDAFIKKISKL
jgi:hypothetical protein